VECEYQGCDRAAEYALGDHYYCAEHLPNDRDETAHAGAPLTMQAQMAGFVLGPILADEGIRDALRDATVAELGALKIRTIFLEIGEDDGPTEAVISMERRDLAEVFMSRIAAEFGFTIPNYGTWADFT
jgi:hypothetical protein